MTKDAKIIGHQTLQCIERFPFEYRVQVDDELVGNQSHETVQTWSIRVSIENGEKTVFLNGTGNFILIPNETNLEKLDIQLNFFKS